MGLTESSFEAFVYYLKTTNQEAVILNLMSTVSAPFNLRKGEVKITLVSERQSAQKQDTRSKEKSSDKFSTV